jgi:hypothetical protein
MKRIYKPYTVWEDWLNGMWRSLPKNEEPAYLAHAIEFTGNHEKYGAAMLEVSHAWPNTMLNSLTNPSINRRAFLGHCACQFKINCPEYIVRMAWKELTDEQRTLADKQAEKYIKLFLHDLTEKNRELHKGLGE